MFYKGRAVCLVEWISLLLHNGQERLKRGGKSPFFFRKKQKQRASRTRSVMVVLQKCSWVTLVSTGVFSAPLPTMCAQPVCKLCQGFLGSQNN